MTEGASLNCQELVELVTDYLEGALEPPRRQAFELHIGRCNGCKAYLDQLEATVRLTGTLTSDDLSPHVEETLLAAFRDWRKDS